MAEPTPQPFRAEQTAIGVSRDGATVALHPMTPEAARTLGLGLGAIDPWARVPLEPEAFVRFFAAVEGGATRYQIHVGTALAGAMVVRIPWLSGPYLNILGMLPEFQRRGIGRLALDWLEAEARRGSFRNIWLCVSSSNRGAERLYEAHGFTRVAKLDGLMSEGFDENLMRKRLG